MYILIDNYDSFTYNLWHYFGELDIEAKVIRNDAMSCDEVLELGPDGIILSPGPCAPDQAGICLDLVSKAKGQMPIFGVCLGHQTIGQMFGGRIVRAPKPMHGKVSPITHEGKSVFKGLPSPLNVTRYHSLTIDPASLPDCLEVTAMSEDGVIQGVAHKDYPIHGVQFHPESIASENGHQMLRNFLDLT